MSNYYLVTSFVVMASTSLLLLLSPVLKSEVLSSLVLHVVHGGGRFSVSIPTGSGKSIYLLPGACLMPSQ